MQLAEVTAKLLTIEREIEALNPIFIEWAEEFHGNDFPEQTALAICLENTLQAVTHGMATTIGFTRYHMENLVRFIEFRCCWSQLSTAQLEAILDCDIVPIRVIQELNPLLGADATAKIKELRKEWNKQFANKSYAKMANQFMRA